MRFTFPQVRRGEHKWFAWHPVPLSPYKGEWAWLEYVMRERDYIDGGWLCYQFRKADSARGEP